MILKYSYNSETNYYNFREVFYLGKELLIVNALLSGRSFFEYLKLFDFCFEDVRSGNGYIDSTSLLILLTSVQL